MKYRDINDYEVMYLIEENTEEAEDLLYQKYRPLILSCAHKYFKAANGRGLELEDFIQEGYVGLARAIQRYTIDKDCMFYTFALLCIDRQMQTVLRNAKSQKQEVLNNALSLDYELPSTDMIVSDVVEDQLEPNPLDLVIDLENWVQLTDFCNDLPFVQSQVFELRYHGFSYDEIGKLLDLSKKSIDSHLVRIRRKLRQSGLRKILV